MSKFANTLAPNLFDTYEAWEENWVRVVGQIPDSSAIQLAITYFSGEIVDET